ncbi:MAG: hypothetical protein QMD65_02680 [Patescibacteria group bacterium]|nr:hypothetical protein [Patescibacteria group bacterium]
MKKSIIAIIIIIILILVAVYVIYAPRVNKTSDQTGGEVGQKTENLVQDVQNIDLGNIDQEFQQIDSDLNSL